MYSMIYLIISILCSVFTVILSVNMSIKHYKNNVAYTNWYSNYETISKSVYIIFLTVCVILAFFLYIYKLTEIPRGVHIDEMFAAYDAFCISNFGVTRWLNSFPVYCTHTWGGQSVFFMYLVSILYKLFDIHNIFLLRLPFAIMSVLQIVFASICVREIKGNFAGILTACLMLICPYFIMRARFGLDCNMMLTVSVISLCFTVMMLKYKKNRYFILSGIFWGLTLYTYALAYLVVPLFCLLLLIYLLYTDKEIFNIKRCLLFAIPLAVLAFPLLTMIFINTYDLNQICIFGITIPKIPGYRGSEISLSGIIKNLKMPYTLLIGDKITYSSIKPYCTLYIMSIPFVVYGGIKELAALIISIKERKFSINSVMMIFLIAIIIMGLLQAPGININKLNAAYFSLLLFIVISLCDIAKCFAKKYNVILIIMYIVNFAFFGYYYFAKYSTEIYPQWNFNYNIGEIVTDIKNNTPDKDVYVDSSYVYYFFENSISPYDFFDINKIKEIDQTPTYKGIHFYIPKDNYDKNAIYIFKQDNEELNEFKKNIDTNWKITSKECYEIYEAD